MLLKRLQISVIIGLSLLVALAAGTDAIVGFARNANFGAALAIYPNDPVARTALSEQNILSGIEPAKLPLIGYFAKRSILSQALNARGLGQLALSLTDKNQPRAETLMRLAVKMSRRDLIVQLWQVEQSKADGKIGQALYHFDIGMRTRSSGWPYFFPILTSDLEDADFRQKFAPYLHSKPIWLNFFLAHAISNSANPENIASMIQNGGGLPDGTGFRDNEAALLSQLLIKSGSQAVKSFYASLKRSSSADVLTSLRFSKISTDVRRSPVTWSTLQSANGESAFFENASTKTMNLKAIISAGQREIIARKLVFLTAGRYRPSLKLGPSQMGQGASVYATLTCVDRGKSQLVWQDVFTISVPPKPMIIPANCEAQYFDLWLYGGDNQGGAELVVQSASIEPLIQ